MRGDWSRLRALFEGARERPANERVAFLQVHTEGDESLRREIESLLAAYEAAERFLDDLPLTEPGDHHAGPSRSDDAPPAPSSARAATSATLRFWSRLVWAAWAMSIALVIYGSIARWRSRCSRPRCRWTPRVVSGSNARLAPFPS